MLSYLFSDIYTEMRKSASYLYSDICIETKKIHWIPIFTVYYLRRAEETKPVNHYLRIDEEAYSYLFQEMRRDEKNSLGYPFFNIYAVMIRPSR